VKRVEAVELAAVMALRGATGASLSDCRAALATAGGDQDAAAAILARYAASPADRTAPGAFWHYHCDFGHQWVLYRATDAAERPADAVCPHGHEAVTRQVLRHADRARLELVPAARVYPTGRGEAVMAEGLYRLALSRLDGTGELQSEREYDWEQAVALAARFRGLAYFQCVGVWRALGP
jgi:hypothetical protein